MPRALGRGDGGRECGREAGRELPREEAGVVPALDALGVALRPAEQPVASRYSSDSARTPPASRVASLFSAFFTARLPRASTAAALASPSPE